MPLHPTKCEDLILIFIWKLNYSKSFYYYHKVYFATGPVNLFCQHAWNKDKDEQTNVCHPTLCDVNMLGHAFISLNISNNLHCLFIKVFSYGLSIVSVNLASGIPTGRSLH